MVRRCAHMRPVALQNVASCRGLAEAREARDGQPRAAHDPQRRLAEAGVEHVGQRDVLQPARERVEADAAARRRVGQPHGEGVLEATTDAGMGDELVEVGGGGAHAPPRYRARTTVSDPAPDQTRSLPAKRATICKRVQDRAAFGITMVMA